jgi:hypothetical protein
MRGLVHTGQLLHKGPYQLASHFGFIVSKADDVGLEAKRLVRERPDCHPLPRHTRAYTSKPRAARLICTATTRTAYMTVNPISPPRMTCEARSAAIPEE